MIGRTLAPSHHHNLLIMLTLKGTENGDMVDFEGTALQLPGVAFKAVLTRFGD